MVGGSFQPDFKGFAALQNEPAEGSLDPNLNVDQEEVERVSDEVARENSVTFTISMYQDPRDALDLERHQRGGIGSIPRGN